MHGSVLHIEDAGDGSLRLRTSVPDRDVLTTIIGSLVATDDTGRSMRAFGKFDTPVLGIVENMQTFVCPDCDSAHDVFGAGGGEALAEETGLPYLGALPLDPQVRMDGDDGEPIVLGEGETATAFRELAGRVADNVGLLRRHRRMENVTKPGELSA